MGFKDLQAWVRGGVIGCIVAIIIFIVIFLVGGPYAVYILGWPLRGFSFIFELPFFRSFLNSLLPLIHNDLTIVYISSLFAFIFWIILGFTLGAFIWGIYEKAKKQQRNFVIILIGLIFGLVIINFLLRTILLIILGVNFGSKVPMLVTLSISGLFGTWIGWLLGNKKTKR